ncbi:carbohydrate binding domain-containing protein [Chitinophaga sp. CF418]|uniref:carbohydrate binding domain-containing protein n=1 Tax=Chitinophaga sp. CF418 TaxID=1855287 RepID=UPI000913F045|nr:carbohydrate binding domain-containing protein [Chitinophaga sp. CF418]SHN38872.1 Carbohydrate binding domain-containing protein [Chitinophaga sp. CF418]
MKRIMLWLLPLLGVLPLRAQERSNHLFKVFSRYDYYQPLQAGSVVCVIPDSLPAADYQLVLFHNATELGRSAGASGHWLAAPVALQQLSAGETSLQYRLLYARQLVDSGSVVVRQLPAKRNAVQIDRLTGGLIADGLPFFPFGFYCVGVGDLAEKEVAHGFNMIGTYQSNLAATFGERKAYMDRCAQLGVRVNYGVNSLVGGGHNGAKGLDMTEDEKLAILKREVLAFRDHPALLAWYINDEPDGQGRPPAVLEKAYQLIKELDPYHPISVVFMMPQKINDFRNTMDIAMTDPYPIPGKADKVAEDVQYLNNRLQYEKSVWLVPQAFGGQEMWSREPTANEIRLMTYMGLVNGAKGIQYYVHAPGNLNPQSVSAWSACSDMAVETAQMTPFLLSADPAPAVHSEDRTILTRAFRYKGNLLVVAVNNENKPKTLSLHTDVKEGGLSADAELWFENRAVPFTGGDISDIIDAYSTRVYLVRAAEEKSSPLLYPGNLTLNPGFEKVVSPGLPIGSNVKSTVREKADAGATFFADSRLSKEGMFSLRLTTPTDSGGNKIRLVPMVINAGNSYTVSVWARAKEQDKMPSFRMGIEVAAQEQVFKLSNDWQKYSFTFRAANSSTNAILTLEVPDQGMAWFDLLQVCPDPVIRYEINADHTANVNISSSSNDAVLKYAIDRLPDAGAAEYHSPLKINTASIVYAALFDKGKLIAGSQAFIPVNKALGKPVTLETPFHASYPAAGAATLVDGIMGTTAFKDGRWLGFLGKDVSAVVDMQTIENLSNVSVNFLADPNSGIFLPSEVSIYTSVDGKQYELAGTARNAKGSVRGEPYLQSFRINVKKKKARYIRFTAKTIGTIPDGYLFKGSTSWLFVDEVLVQ